MFVSSASDLVAGDTNGTVGDVFVRDLVANTTTLVSVTPGGASGNDESGWPTITPGGTLVVFESAASDLVAGDTNLRRDVFARDLLGNTTERLSVSTTGTQSNGSSGSAGHWPSLTTDDTWPSSATPRTWSRRRSTRTTATTSSCATAS